MALEVVDVVYQGGGLIVTFNDGSWTTAVMETVGGLVRYSGLTEEQREALRRFNQTSVTDEVSQADARVGITQQQAQVIQQEIIQITEEAAGGAAPYDAWGDGKLSVRVIGDYIPQATSNVKVRVTAHDVITSVQADPDATLTYGIRIWTGQDGFNNYDGNSGNPGPLSESTDPKEAYIDFDMRCGLPQSPIGNQINVRVYVSDGTNTVWAWLEIAPEDFNGFNASGPITLLTPANGATVPNDDIDVSWSQDFPNVEIDSGSVYRFFLDTVNPPLNEIFTLEETSWTIPKDQVEELTTYYWQVKTFDCQGIEDSAVSPVRSFVIGDLPDQASNPTPSPGATEVDPNQDLSWDPATGATSYDVYFWPSPGVPVFIGNQPGTTYDPGTMGDGNYEWRIDTRNAAGVTEGLIWSFNVGAAP